PARSRRALPPPRRDDRRGPRGGRREPRPHHPPPRRLGAPLDDPDPPHLQGRENRRHLPRGEPPRRRRARGAPGALPRGSREDLLEGRVSVAPGPFSHTTRPRGKHATFSRPSRGGHATSPASSPPRKSHVRAA